MLVALLGAIVIGISLGLLGSGGSILTVPILIFILQRPEKLAIAESLAIVACVAVAGALPYALRAQIHWKSVLYFGLPGMLGAYLGAYGASYMSSMVQLTLFSLIMLLVAGMMFFNFPSFEKTSATPYSIWLTVLEGFIVGCLTGCLGIGGGFLIVPTLVLFNNLSMFFAIGTSLIIIAMNALTGFIRQLVTLNALHMQVSWETIGMISIAGILGCLMGSLINTKISQQRLRQGFSLSILMMGIYLILKQI